MGTNFDVKMQHVNRAAYNPNIRKAEPTWKLASKKWHNCLAPNSVRDCLNKLSVGWTSRLILCVHTDWETDKYTLHANRFIHVHRYKQICIYMYLLTVKNINNIIKHIKNMIYNWKQRNKDIQKDCFLFFSFLLRLFLSIV